MLQRFFPAVSDAKMTAPAKLPERDLFSETIAKEAKFHTHSYFEPFPVANEGGYFHNLYRLNQIKPSVDDNQIAFLTGEASVISSLPEFLKLNIRTIICNDINQLILMHIQHQLKCLRKANSIQEFEKLYKTTFMDEEIFIQDNYNRENLFAMLKQDDDGGHYEYCFLSSDERFLVCKKAAEKITFIYTSINLFKPDAVACFAQTLKKFNYSITVLNNNNLHHYDTGNVLGKVTDLLLQSSYSPLIFYSVGPEDALDRRCLCSKLSVGKEAYTYVLTSVQRMRASEKLKEELEQEARAWQYDDSFEEGPEDFGSCDEPIVKLDPKEREQKELAEKVTGANAIVVRLAKEYKEHKLNLASLPQFTELGLSRPERETEAEVLANNAFCIFLLEEVNAWAFQVYYDLNEVGLGKDQTTYRISDYTLSLGRFNFRLMDIPRLKPAPNMAQLIEEHARNARLFSRNYPLAEPQPVAESIFHLKS